MANEFVLDTHSLLWFLGDSNRLGANAGGVLADSKSKLFLPAISLHEALWIITHKRVSSPTASGLLTALDNDSRIVIVPLDRRIICKTLAIPPGLEMHDLQIVATALLLSDGADPVPVITCDGAITNSGLVPVVW